MTIENKFLHEVVITAIVVKDGKYLIVRRDANKKRFPKMWTVPGGRLESSDYTSRPRDTEHYWYNVLEHTLKREIKEETDLDVVNIEYVTSCARVHEDGAPSIVLACTADYSGGEVKLQAGETDNHAWVTLQEARGYDLIDGIYDEIAMVVNKRKGIRTEWQRVQN